jgi:WD40 repeat protein
MVLNHLLRLLVLVPLLIAGCNHESAPTAAQPPDVVRQNGAHFESSQGQPAAAVRLVEVARFETAIGNCDEVLITPTGDVVVVLDVLGDVEAWDIRSQNLLWEQTTDLYDHHLSTDEIVWLHQSGASRDIVHMDLHTGEERRRTPLQIELVKLWNAVFGWGDTPVLAAQAEYADLGQIVTFSVDTGRLLSRCDMPRDADAVEIGIEGLGISPDGKQLLVTMRGGMLLCERSGNVLHRYPAKNHVSRLLFLADGKRALACGTTFGSPLYFLNLMTGKMIERSEHRWEASSLDVSGDGQWAVTGGRSRFEADRNHYLRTKTSEGGEVVLWHLATDAPVVKINPFVDSVEGVGISVNGRWVAAVESGGQIAVYEVKNL